MACQVLKKKALCYLHTDKKFSSEIMEHSKPLTSKGLPYAIPNKPTTAPIEIPHRCRPAVSRTPPSSVGRPTSPDLIFEMSPVSSESPSAGRFAFSFSASKQLEQEPFMYHFPVLAPRLHPDRRMQRTATNTIYSPPKSPSISNTKHRRSPLSQLNNDDIMTTSSTTTKVMSTTKITGFTPPLQHPLSVQTPCSPARSLNTRRLSPPPRSSSYSSSPWILPGKCDILEGESTSLETDPSAFDFEKHLIRRIDNQNQNPLRFRTLSLIASEKG